MFEFYRVHFSFTKMFGENVWLFLFTFKVMGIITEILINNYLNDDL